MKKLSPKGLLDRLANEALMRYYLCDGNPRKVGQMIKQLSAKQREILKQLTSKDIQGQGIHAFFENYSAKRKYERRESRRKRTTRKNGM